MEMHQIEQLAYELSKARSVLELRVTALEDEIKEAKRRKLRGIKSALAETASTMQRLKDAVESSPQLFVKPRTVTFHRIRVGMQKGKGKIEVSDEQNAIKLVKKHYPEQADVLVAVTEKLVKKALEQLTAQQLKKIGCNVIDGQDAVLVKPVDSAIDKLINGLMKDLEKMEVQDAV